MTHELRQIRPRCSCGSAIWVEVTDAVCVDKASRAPRARARPYGLPENSAYAHQVDSDVAANYAPVASRWKTSVERANGTG